MLSTINGSIIFSSRLLLKVFAINEKLSVKTVDYHPVGQSKKRGCGQIVNGCNTPIKIM